MWDLFCQVVDNYGDIGVSWRLARLLHAEQGAPVRLWVDDLASFAVIEPRIDAAADVQHVEGIEVRRWRDPFPDVQPGDAVIEAFGCRLPDAFLYAMARRDRAPVWINLEYLTAEPWAAECHGLPSPHPRLPLTKHFWFPGLDARSGGVLRERSLAAARDAAQAGGQDHPDHATCVSVFAYDNPAWPDLLDAWIQGTKPIDCRVPEGRAAASLRRVLGRDVGVGERVDRGALSAVVTPFTDQPGYDRLLWSCDWNFVRGEDSFVRAQLAARPLVWHIYPQEAGAHFTKLEAFLDRYTAALPDAARNAVANLMRAWNGSRGAPAIGDAWAAAAASGPALRAHAADWAGQLGAGPELAAGLAEFVRNRLK
jgi:uncharacterized repeat protein (TIGR03837 family)